MQIGEVYPFVITLVLVVMLLGVGLVTFSAFRSSLASQAKAGFHNYSYTIAAFDNGSKAMAPITATWMPLWVTIGSIAVVLSLVLGAFLIGRGRMAR